MPQHREVAVTKGLECGDLLALHRHQPPDHHVEQEGGDAHEHAGEQARQDAELIQFLAEKTVRALVLARVGAQAAIRLEQLIDTVDDELAVGPGTQAQRQVVERSFHIVGLTESTAPHPHHAETLVIGEHRAGAQLLDELRRQCGAHQGQRLTPSVEDRVKAISQLQRMRLRKRRAHHHLVWPLRRRQSALAQMQRIQAVRAAVGYRHHQGAHRLGERRHVEAHLRHHSRLHLIHTGDGLHALAQRLRRPLQRGEHVGEAVVAVIAVLRRTQRIQRGDEHDVGADAAHHHQGDGQRLALHLPQVTPELAVERLHQRSSEAFFLDSLRSMLATSPSLK